MTDHSEFLALSATIRRKLRQHAGARHDANELLVRTIEQDPGQRRVELWALWLSKEAEAMKAQQDVEELIALHGDLHAELLDELEASNQ